MPDNQHHPHAYLNGVLLAVERFGFPIVLNLFLVYVGWKAYERQEKRIDALQSYQTTTLQASLDRCTTALMNVGDVVQLVKDCKEELYQTRKAMLALRHPTDPEDIEP